MLSFDLTIRLGDILTVLAFVIGAIGFAFSFLIGFRLLAARVANVELTVASQSGTIQNLSTALVQVARQEERISALRQSVERLENRVDGSIAQSVR